MGIADAPTPCPDAPTPLTRMGDACTLQRVPAGFKIDQGAMTANPFVPLSDIERDALAELSNIAMAKAASSLRQMIQSEVLLTVPSVDILPSPAATQLIARPDNPRLVAVRQDFAGVFSGRALLIFPEPNSVELVRAVVGRELPLEDIVDLEDEALAETGNIILNSWVATIANLLKSTLKMSLPVVIRGDGGSMFESPISTLVLFLHIKFEIRQKEIAGYVALLMDIPSLGQLRSLIADFVRSITQDETQRAHDRR
jgi:chemotaxis protein CheC